MIRLDFFGKPYMQPGDFFSNQKRFKSGNVLLTQNTIINIEPYTPPGRSIGIFVLFQHCDAIDPQPDTAALSGRL